MSQIETIVSKVRPIKKISIIEDEISTFLKIIQDYSKEIGGFYNLILLNDENLFSQNTIDFVNNHDPDLVINYSYCETEELVKKFKTKVLDGKSKNFEYNLVGTPLDIFDNIPENAQFFFKEIKNINANFASEMIPKAQCS
jgi:hypothetical protein